MCCVSMLPCGGRDHRDLIQCDCLLLHTIPWCLLSQLFSIFRVGSDCEITLLFRDVSDSSSRIFVFFCAFVVACIFLTIHSNSVQCSREAIASFAHALSFSDVKGDWIQQFGWLHVAQVHAQSSEGGMLILPGLLLSLLSLLAAFVCCTFTCMRRDHDVAFSRFHPKHVIFHESSLTLFQVSS